MTLKETRKASHMILLTTDGRTVWVNDRNGHCIGRFSIFGIDIHNTFEVQNQTGKECLYCTHKRTDINDWELFKTKMYELHGIEVPETCKPKRL